MKLEWEVREGEVGNRKCVAALCFLIKGKYKEKLCGLTKMGNSPWAADFGECLTHLKGEFKFHSQLSLSEAQAAILDLVEKELNQNKHLTDQVLSSIKKLQGKDPMQLRK